jgi:hypothetical protein
MNAIALRVDGGSNVLVEQDNIASSLPALIRRASQALANATSAAEVLDAKAMAGVAYDVAKSSARLAKAKGAFDDVIGAVYRAQADALEIEAQAKRRLADEYDAAQERGEVVGNKGGGFRWEREKQTVEGYNSKPTAAELGLDKTEIHHARKLRDAEDMDPGFVRRFLNETIDAGQEPTKAGLSREINTRLSSYSGDNEWYTPSKYVEMARTVMGKIDVDPASNAHAQRTVNAASHYTPENSGLDKEWHGTVWMNPPYSNPEVQQFTDKVVAEYQSGRTTEAVVLTNNSGDTGWHHALQSACAAMCIVKGRIKFESTTRESNSPAMGQSFFYFGDDIERFKDVFSDIGNVWVLA